MEKYSEYKDSGVEWLGEIPSHWELGKFKYNGIFCKGKITKETNQNGMGLPIIGASEMNGKECSNYSTDVHVHLCKKNDILILWDGANAGIIANNLEGVISSTVVKYQITEGNVDKEYAYFQLKNLESFFKEKVGGTTIPHMSMDFINMRPLLLPPLHEQRGISLYLNSQISKIDEAIAQQQKMIDLLNERKQIIINNAVTKGLDPNVPMKDSGVDWIGCIPEHWIVSKAKRYVQIYNGSNPKTEGNVPVYGSGASSFKTCGEYKEGPTVLLGRKGATIDIPHYIEGRYWNVDTAFDVKANISLDLKYYYFLATCFEYDFYIDVTTLPSMTQWNYRNMKIPIPPIKEQMSIVDYLNEYLAVIDNEIHLHLRRISLLQERKQIIINEVVTGKVKVS